MNTNPAPIYDDIDLDEFEDFESDELDQNASDAGNDYLHGMWGRASFRRQGLADAENVVTAHGMVQTFVNAFARDGRYVVVFDENISTAGTDMDAKHVRITPAPVLDPTISAEQAGLILTGLAVHEICHPRYDRATSAAVQRAFGNSASAHRIGNVLSDVRIERRFVADYPGYAGVFAPTLDYVGQASVKANGGQLVKPTDPLNTMTAALRYPTIADWTGLEDERKWWTDWASRWAKHDAPRKHVEAVREALRHIRDLQQQSQQSDQSQPSQSDDSGDAQPSGEGQTSAGSEDRSEDGTSDDMQPGQGAQDGPSGGSSEETSDQTAEGAGDQGDDMSDGDLASAVDADASTDAPLPDCSGTRAVESAAGSSGVSKTQINEARSEAQQTVDNAEHMEHDGHGSSVDVARSTRGLLHGRKYEPRRSDRAARYIRDAFMQSRTGHTAISRYQKRGRLDQRGLHRVASRDFRLFDKKSAPSPDKFLVWVLVDCSGSMGGYPIQHAARVAYTLAEASRDVDTMRMAVWGWSDPFRGSPADAGAARVWQTGQPVNEVFGLTRLAMGGTPDGTILNWAQRAIRREVKNGERPVIIFCSDGGGEYRMRQSVEEARAAGVIVKGVSIGRGMSDEMLEDRYGRDGYVGWAGSIDETARPLAKLLARMVGRDRR